MAEKKKVVGQVTDISTVATFKPLRYVLNILWDTASATKDINVRIPFSPDSVVLRHVLPHVGVGGTPTQLWRIRVQRLIPDDAILTAFYDGNGVEQPSFTPQTEFQMHGQVNGNYSLELINTAGVQTASTGSLFLQLEFYKY